MHQATHAQIPLYYAQMRTAQQNTSYTILIGHICSLRNAPPE